MLGLRVLGFGGSGFRVLLGGSWRIVSGVTSGATILITS